MLVPMGLRSIGAIALLGVAVGAAPSCSTENYGCSADDNCQLDSVEGWCEGSGFCSFPDLDCASGREYGDLAGDGLAGTCVPEAGTDDGSGGGSASSGATEPSAPNDSESGDSDTGDTPTACAQEVSDDFEDGVLDSVWGRFGLTEAQALWVDETDGAMTVSLPPDADGYAGITLASVIDLTEASIQLEVETGPNPASALIVAVGSLDGDSQLNIYLYESDAAVVYVPDDGAREVEILADFLPLSVAETPWVELVYTGAPADSTLTVRASPDGNVFTDVASVEHVVPLDGSVLFVYGISIDPKQQAGDTIRVSTVDICGR